LVVVAFYRTLTLLLLFVLSVLLKLVLNGLIVTVRCLPQTCLTGYWRLRQHHLQQESSTEHVSRSKQAMEQNKHA
jgi:hypothetical protein